MCALCIKDCFTSKLEENLKRECPVCRVEVVDKPANALALQSILDKLVEDMSAGEEKDFIRNRMSKASELVKSESWIALFPTETILKNYVYDASDRVYRCGSCNGEIAGGRCSSCDYAFDELIDLTKDYDELDSCEEEDIDSSEESNDSFIDDGGIIEVNESCETLSDSDEGNEEDYESDVQIRDDDDEVIVSD